IAGEDLGALAQQLVGPRRPDKAADMKNWPDEDERRSRLDVLIAALASDHPAQRYAATQVLTLRGQPLAFWREAARLIGPSAADRPRIPFTNWESDESIQPRKQGWLRSLFTRAAPAAPASATERVLEVIKFAGAPAARGAPPTDLEFTDGHARRLAFGTYAGLVRQAPARGESDETHRIRRDSIDRIAALATADDVGRAAALPVLRRALSDPHHLVRRAAVGVLTGLYPDGSLEPHRLALQASAADVGRSAVDALIAAALAEIDAGSGDDAQNLAKGAIDAPVAEVRAYAMAQIQRLYDADSLDPWLIALGSRYADVRLAVVDRLVDSTDSRVPAALGRALESDHEDLRLKAAVALARRGDPRTVDVLATMLRSEERSTANRASEALIALAHARPQDPKADEIAAAAATAIAARLDDDPDQTADRPALIRALGRIGSPAAGEVLLGLMGGDSSNLRSSAFSTLMDIARDRGRPARVSPDGTRREVYREALALDYLGAAAASTDEQLRLRTTQVLRHIDDRAAEDLLSLLVDDREQAVRVSACEALAFRAEYVPDATIDSLAQTLRAGRRELVLPAAAGLAARGRPEALQALLLVFKAGEQDERERAVLALGILGDRRALEELEPLVDSKNRAELEDEDAVLIPTVIEALGRMLPRLVDSDEHGPEHTRIRELVEHTAREGDDQLRRRAITGLRHAGDERSRTVLERIAADPLDDRSMRSHAVAELGQLARPESEAVLAELLSDSNHYLRHAALDALRRTLPGQRTRTSLLALRSPHDDISAPAASFLARRGDPATLIARLSEIDSTEVRQRLRQGLIRRGACPVPEVAAVLGGDAVGPRVDAAWLAGSSGQTELAAAVADAAERSARDWATARARASGGTSTDQDTAEEAWRASIWAADRLAADAGTLARAVLTTDDAPPAVVAAALRFLGNHGRADDVTAIRPSLSASDAAVRVAAAATIARLDPDQSEAILADTAVADPAAMTPVTLAALASSPGAAAEMLDRDAARQLVLPVVLGARRVDDLIAAARVAGEGEGRMVAISSLGRIGDDRARQTLEAMAGDSSEPDPVRAAAFRALRRLQRRAAKLAKYQEVAAQ
ncbi:MAG: HEAT repeat domain-containing protein, partial [Myxococcota bacterium]